MTISNISSNISSSALRKSSNTVGDVTRKISSVMYSYTILYKLYGRFIHSIIMKMYTLKIMPPVDKIVNDINDVDL